MATEYEIVTQVHKPKQVTMVQEVSSSFNKQELLQEMEVIISKQLDQRLEGHQKRRPPNLQKIACLGCKQMGHFQRDCPQGKVDSKQGAPRQQGENTEGKTPLQVTAGQEATVPAGSSARSAHVFRVQKQSGWFVATRVNEQPVTFLVDSGASCSMIDISVFKSISKIHPMELSPVTERFILADGSDLAVIGEVDVELQTGEQLLLVTMVVAELGDDYNAILGLNFMEEQDVILRVSHGKMIIGNETVPLHRENAERGCCRISMGNTLTTAPSSCRVVEAEVDMGKSVDSNWMHEDCILGCLPTLAETSGVVMGSEIVKIHEGEVPVNLINVHDRPLNVFKGRTLGSLQPVKTVSLIQPGDDTRQDKSSRESLTIINN